MISESWRLSSQTVNEDDTSGTLRRCKNTSRGKNHSCVNHITFSINAEGIYTFYKTQHQRCGARSRAEYFTRSSRTDILPGTGVRLIPRIRSQRRSDMTFPHGYDLEPEPTETSPVFRERDPKSEPMEYFIIHSEFELDPEPICFLSQSRIATQCQALIEAFNRKQAAIMPDGCA